MLGEEVPDQFVGVQTVEIEVEPDMLTTDHFIMLHPWGAIAVGVDRFFYDRTRARCQVAERRGCAGSVLAGPVGKDLGDGGVPLPPV